MRSIILLLAGSLAFLMSAGCLGGACEPNGRLLLAARPQTDGGRVELTEEQVASIPELASLVDTLEPGDTATHGVGIDRADAIVAQVRAWGATGDRHEAFFDHKGNSYSLSHQRICRD